MELTPEQIAELVSMISEARAEHLRALDTEALSAHRDAVATSFAALTANTDLSDDDLTLAENLAEISDVIVAELAAREQAVADRQARLDSIRTRITPTPPPAAEEAPEAEAVAASATPPPAAAPTPPPAPAPSVARRQVAALVPDLRPQLRDVLTAAADVPGLNQGAGYDSYEAMAEAAERRFKGLVNAATAPGKYQSGLAVLTKPTEIDPRLVAETEDADEAIEWATSLNRIGGRDALLSLTAATGWCAPSETLYDYCEIGSGLDGILDLPEITARRGGVRWTQELSFCDAFGLGSGFFDLTEAQVIADTAKTCVDITCPTFEEERLDAVGVCISSSLLTRRGYPERVAEFIRKVLIAHAHKMNVKVINQMVAGSTDATPGAPNLVGLSVTDAIVGGLTINAAAYRDRNRLAMDTILEAVLPHWVVQQVQLDILRRNGNATLGDARNLLRSLLAQHDIRVQFVYDWQPLQACGAAIPVTFPDTVQFLLYKAGTWVKATSEVITLDTVYSQAQLVQNKYTALFTEEGLQVIKKCSDSVQGTIEVCASGATASQAAISCTLGVA
jgi:hypothetical protein